MPTMDKKILNDFSEASEGKNAKKGVSPHLERPPSFFDRWSQTLYHLGLGGSVLRVATNTLLLFVSIGVVFLMRSFFQSAPPEEVDAAPQIVETIAPPEADTLEATSFLVKTTRGVYRQAQIHTIIPDRPREEVITYDVQDGDTIFAIAEQFGLNPQTILWGNYNTLLDDPHNLRAGQTLNILPVDGTYYEWQDGDSLNGVAEFFGVTPEDIIDYAPNRLNPDTIGDYANPNIAPGMWLIVPGGERLFISWSAPVGVTRDNPAVARILGDGSCGAVEGGAVGFGTFVWPSENHYLSGYDWSPETNHRGIDIAGQEGMGIYAADAGVIVYAGWNDYGYGNMIMIDHGTGFQTLYAHLSALYVGCGQSVGRGQAIGAFGSTGRSSGPHLHFEIMTSIYGKVNPWDFLPPP